jgi:hypothetical protein
MRTTLIAVLLAFVGVSRASAGTEAPPSWLHARPVTPSARQLLADAVDRVPEVRALLDAIERTDVVVYVSDSMAVPASGPRAYLWFVTRVAGLRYVAVEIDRWQSSPTDRIAWLAHELQHVLEVANAPSVQDADGLARLYRHIGWQCRPGQYESEAAQDTGRRVRFQLVAGNR